MISPTILSIFNPPYDLTARVPSLLEILPQSAARHSTSSGRTANYFEIDAILRLWYGLVRYVPSHFFRLFLGL
jgi:hypothetical protein